MNEGNPIMELARQANLPSCHLTHPKALARFAALVRAQALEEAAGVCENTLAHHYMEQVIPTHDEVMLLAACADCASAIRALKEQT